MIKNDFYPDSDIGTISTRTDTISNLNIKNGSFPDAYYLGYISSDNLPNYANVTYIETDKKSDKITFKQLLIPNNYNCGYLFESNTLPFFNASFNNEYFNEQWTDSYRFLNKLNVQGNFFTYFYSIKFIVVEGTKWAEYTVYINNDEMYNFLFNDGTLVATLDIRREFRATDFDEYGVCTIDEKKFFILGYDINTDDKNTTFPFYFIGELDNTGIELTLPYTQLLMTIGTYDYRYSGISTLIDVRENTTSIVKGCFQGDISMTELDNAVNTGECYLKDGLFFDGYTTYNGSKQVGTSYVLRIDDIRKTMGLCIKLKSSDHPTLYMPYVTPSGEFTATTITGDITDENFKSQLRPWQYETDAWADETYTPDDKPGYVPGGGDDTPVTPDDFGDIPLGWFPAQNSIGGFVKYYMLNSLAVASLGKSLWDGLAGYTPPAGDVMTKNMIDNFYLNYSPSFENFDLSLTLSNVIDYFTGIRYFPIPNLPQSTGNSVAPVTSVNVGTGSTPIDIVGSGLIGGQGFLISNRLVTLSGGSVSGSEIRQNLYNNFLDYEPNVSCSVYIPYCGSVSLQPSTVLDPSMTSLEIRYGLDLYTGSICAVLMKNGKASFPLAISEGVIGFDLPLTGNNFNTQAISTMLSTARFENNLTASLIGTTSQAIGQAFTDPLGSIGTSLGAGISTANKEMNLALSYPQMIGTSPIAVGRTSSMAGMIQPTRAFIQFVKHSAEIPDNYGNIFGFNSNTYDTIGNQQGFFVCVNPRLDGIPCTQAERDEIYKLLTTGVYIS